MKRFVLVSLIFTTALAFAQDKVDQQFQVEKGQRLDLNFDEIGGAIEVTGWDKYVVQIEGEMTGRGWDDDCRLEFKQSSRGLRVVPYCGYGNDWIEADLAIKVPRQFDIVIRSATQTKITNIEGDLDVGVGNANLEIANVKGHIELNNANGRMKITDSKLDGDIRNVNGRLTLQNTDVAGEVRTVNSGMTLHSANSGIKVSSVNGRIKIDSAKEFVEAQTTNASVEISELDGRLEAETLNGHVIVNMTGDPEQGNHDIELETMNGDIELFFADDFPMEVDIEIRKDYDTRNRQQFREKYEIVSDFDITTEAMHRGDLQVVGQGTVGSGRNKVRIRATNGDVYLKKRS